MTIYNHKISNADMDDIAIYMDDDIREKVHFELAPCTPEEFIARYLELDPEFQDFLVSEFDFRVEENKQSVVNGIVNKILEGSSVRDVLCVKINEGFSEEFKQEIINNPVNKKIKKIADKYGYVAKETFLYWYGGIHCSISPKNHGDYHPEVYISNDFHDDDDGVDYEIQTTSYGALSLDDYKEFLKCCDDAYNMMREISELDLTKLAKEVKSE